LQNGGTESRAIALRLSGISIEPTVTARRARQTDGSRDVARERFFNKTWINRDHENLDRL
jgi:hypothetical protein